MHSLDQELQKRGGGDFSTFVFICKIVPVLFRHKKILSKLCVGKRFCSLASLLSLINTIPTPLAKICDQDLGEFHPGHVLSTAGRDNWFALIPSQCIVPL